MLSSYKWVFGGILLASCAMAPAARAEMVVVNEQAIEDLAPVNAAVPVSSARVADPGSSAWAEPVHSRQALVQVRDDAGDVEDTPRSAGIYGDVKHKITRPGSALDPRLADLAKQVPEREKEKKIASARGSHGAAPELESHFTLQGDTNPPLKFKKIVAKPSPSTLPSSPKASPDLRRQAQGEGVGWKKSKSQEVKQSKPVKVEKTVAAPAPVAPVVFEPQSVDMLSDDLRDILAVVSPEAGPIELAQNDANPFRDPEPVSKAPAVLNPFDGDLNMVEPVDAPMKEDKPVDPVPMVVPVVEEPMIDPVEKMESLLGEEKPSAPEMVKEPAPMPELQKTESVKEELIKEEPKKEVVKKPAPVVVPDPTERESLVDQEFERMLQQTGSIKKLQKAPVQNPESKMDVMVMPVTPAPVVRAAPAPKAAPVVAASKPVPVAPKMPTSSRQNLDSDGRDNLIDREFKRMAQQATEADRYLKKMPSAARVVVTPKPAPVVMRSQPVLSPQPVVQKMAPVMHKPVAPRQETPISVPESSFVLEPVLAIQNGVPPHVADKQNQFARVTFDGNAMDVSDAQLDGLKNVARTLRDHPRYQAEIKAFAAGSQRDVSRSRRTSLTRALAVRNLLVQMGIENHRLQVRAMGIPLDEGPNDRVDITVR